MLHVDDYLNSPDADPIAKEFLNHARRPAGEQNRPWMAKNAPTVKWQGKEYRCVGASRLGDVWLKGDGPPNAFYDYRVDVAELSGWRKPGERIYGWYDSPDQKADQPSYDPAFPGPCLFCAGQTTEDNVRTIALLPTEQKRPQPRSYFYRVHRTCHADATPAQQNAIDCVVLEAIAHNHD